MRRTISYIGSSLLAAAALFAGCEDIDADARFGRDPIDFTPMKNVLVEDFTGQLCLNCPTAAEAVHALQSLYGEEHVVAVAIHGGAMKLSLPYSNVGQLATEVGDAFNERWGVSVWPMGMVDRGPVQEYTAWSGRAVARMQQAAKVALSAELVDDDAAALKADSITLGVSLEGIEGGAGRLSVWLVEDGIVGLQRMPDNSTNPRYTHNHVFRAALNDPYGDPVAFDAGGRYDFRYGYVLPAHWNRANLSAVAFVWNEAEGVLQVVRQELGLD
ncbi:MAG: Omp28 family outer membrane lipoprotein [Alloprevotella sp.]|nr:Omp28 family outer membrane lipoprotein [Alloprevotella sp.]